MLVIWVMLEIQNGDNKNSNIFYRWLINFKNNGENNNSIFNFLLFIFEKILEKMLKFLVFSDYTKYLENFIV